tara:strand:+ start:1927 stop:2181 length:255 start_codon:yes stop_codon:yes gene_type:complete
MDYNIEFTKEFEKSIKKLKKKDFLLFTRVQKKLEELIVNPNHYKPLRNVLFGFRRLHIGSFVLIYTIEEKTVIIISLDHHNKAY